MMSTATAHDLLRFHAQRLICRAHLSNHCLQSYEHWTDILFRLTLLMQSAKRDTRTHSTKLRGPFACFGMCEAEPSIHTAGECCAASF